MWNLWVLSIWKFFTPMKIYLYYFFDNCFSFIFCIFCLNSGYSHVGPPGLILNFPICSLSFPPFCHFGLFSKVFPKFIFYLLNFIFLKTFLDFSGFPLVSEWSFIVASYFMDMISFYSQRIFLYIWYDFAPGLLSFFSLRPFPPTCLFSFTLETFVKCRTMFSCLRARY